MKQILIIHGGDSFDSHRAYLENLKNTSLDYDRIKYSRSWKDTIFEAYDHSADVLTPTMPNSANAQYEEWKIWFEKIIPYLGNDVYLVGHSLGAMFLAKYLHESPLTNPVKKLILIAAGYNETVDGYGSFEVQSAKGVERSAKETHLFHSRDDVVVPFEALAKYARDIPSAQVHEFDNRNHFFDTEFPELIALLK